MKVDRKPSIGVTQLFTGPGAIAFVRFLWPSVLDVDLQSVTSKCDHCHVVLIVINCSQFRLHSPIHSGDIEVKSELIYVQMHRRTRTAPLLDASGACVGREGTECQYFQSNPSVNSIAAVSPEISSLGTSLTHWFAEILAYM